MNKSSDLKTEFTDDIDKKLDGKITENDINDDMVDENLDDIIDDCFTSEDQINTENKTRKFIVADEYQGYRIDKFLSVVQEESTRTYLQKLILEQRVLCNGKKVKANAKLKAGDEVIISLPEIKKIDVVAKNIPLDILYEDDDVILVNKPKGMVVHPAAGHYDDTLVNALLYHCKGNLSGINGVMRPGIVHRIDRDTTGVLIVCKNDNAHQSISAQLKEHSIHRVYEAIVYGVVKDSEGRIESSIGRHPTDRKKMAMNVKNGKNAITNYRVLDILKNKYTHIECKLETGRTHQIRVHMAGIHHPLLGDTVYGPSKDPFHIEGQALHAKLLGFIHPVTKEYMEFAAPLPDYFKELLDKLK